MVHVNLYLRYTLATQLIVFIFRGLFEPHLITLAQWLYVTFSCDFDFTTYPFDSHSCTLPMTTSMDSIDTVIFNSISLSNFSQFDQKIVKSSLTQSAFNCKVTPINPTNFFGGVWNESLVGLRFDLERNEQDRTRIYIQFHIPTGIFALISHIGFFVDSNQVPGRLGSLITLYLISVNTYNSLGAPQLQNQFRLTLGSLWAHFGFTVSAPLVHYGFTVVVLWSLFWLTLGALWAQFGLSLGSVWAQFGLTLGSLWAHFGRTLALL